MIYPECVFFPVNCMQMYSAQDNYLSKTTATKVQSCGLEKSFLCLTIEGVKCTIEFWSLSLD